MRSSSLQNYAFQIAKRYSEAIMHASLFNRLRDSFCCILILQLEFQGFHLQHCSCCASQCYCGLFEEAVVALAKVSTFGRNIAEPFFSVVPQCNCTMNPKYFISDLLRRTRFRDFNEIFCTGPLPAYRKSVSEQHRLLANSCRLNRARLCIADTQSTGSDAHLYEESDGTFETPVLEADGRPSNCHCSKHQCPKHYYQLLVSDIWYDYNQLFVSFQTSFLWMTFELARYDSYFINRHEVDANIHAIIGIRIYSWVLGWTGHRYRALACMQRTRH